MPLTPGDKLGSYEILGPLGAGGMGEVYRARDAKLNREVAIKVLPSALASDADYLARFQREAQALAALNHPNIAAIYGLEGNAIVMELVEGENLRGPLPVKDLLAIARQIAEALEAAHEKGIIHRDLKPGNIKLTPEGIVKVLDFGLAKSVERHAVPSSADSPTLTLRATEAGVILGTAAYMSPEQAAGRPVDRRADFWSFGVVLYELFTGARLFAGETVSHTLADVLRADIDLTKVPEGPLRELIRRCLDRNLKNRLSSAGEARYIIDHFGTNQAAVASAKANYWPWGIAAMACLALLAVSFADFRQPPPELPVRVVSINAPEKTTFEDFALSPDGKMLAFTAIAEGKRQLWVRPLNGSTAQPLAGTERAEQPFWSPDNRWIAFFAAGKLKKVEATGGPVQSLCDVPAIFLGGSWSADGVILAGTSGQGLLRVPAGGGTPVAVTTLDRVRGERDHTWPVFLPGGRRYLFLLSGSDPNTSGIYLGTLDSRERTRLVGDNSSPGYAEGQLLFVRQGTLLAQRLDTEHGAVTGEAFPVAKKIGRTPSYFAGYRYGAAGSGLLAFAPGGAGGARLTWVDRAGAVVETVGEPVEGQLRLALASDEKRVAFSSIGNDTNPDIWVRDLVRGVATRFTFHPAVEFYPVWSPDGSRMVFSSNREGAFDLYSKSTNGAGQDELLLKRGNPKYPTSWSADGRWLLYYEIDPRTKRDLWVLPLEGEKEPVVVLRTEFNERDGVFSPDGKWIAYASDESGKFEVYVQPFPATGAKWQVSKNGGARPRWRRDGREIYWLNEDGTLWAADVTAGPAFQSGLPRRLFETGIQATNESYAVSADGKRFLIPMPVESEGSRTLTVIQNWLGAAKR